MATLPDNLRCNSYNNTYRSIIWLNSRQNYNISTFLWRNAEVYHFLSRVKRLHRQIKIIQTDKKTTSSIKALGWDEAWFWRMRTINYYRSFFIWFEYFTSFNMIFIIFVIQYCLFMKKVSSSATYSEFRKKVQNLK